MADWGQPKPRHQYTYMPRPYPGQKGALVYSGPLNGTAAVQGYGGYGAAGYGGYGGVGYGVGGYGGAYGTAGYGVRRSYGVGAGAYYPSGYNAYTTPYTSYGGYGGGYPNNYSYGGYGYGGQQYYGRYANCFYPQSSYYHRVGVAGAVAPYSYGYPAQTSTTTYVATAAAQPQPQPAPASTVQYAYVQAAATPSKLPEVYHTVNYATRLATAPTREDIQIENRRVATERGAYRPRKIKPADAKPDDVFWVRERNGDWHCRPYYQIEEQCQPGIWQMDAEHGFLVFHRE